MAENTESIDTIFVKKKPPLKNALLLISGFSLLILVLLFFSLGTYSTTQYKFNWKDPAAAKDFRVFVLSFLIGLLGNLLAAVLYLLVSNRFLQKEEQSKIKAITNLAQESLLSDIFKELKYYDRRYCEDYQVIAKLKKHPTNKKFLVCEVKFHHRKILKTTDLIFQFVRIKTEADVQQISGNEYKLSENYLRNQFYHTFDERAYTDIREEELIYRVNYLQVIGNNRTMRLVPKESMNGNTIVYSTCLDNDIDVSKLVTIDYEVEYVIENESMTSFTCELPMNGIRFEFDYSEVMDQVDFYAYDYLSSHRGPIQLHSLNEPRVRLVKEGWILPKSSFLFIWYQKENNG